MAVYERNPNTGVETTVAGIQDLSVYENRISDIEDVIPSDATSSNQLVTESDLGTAAAKDFTDTVRPNSHDLVESNAVYNAINNAMSTIYTPRGSISCAELSPNLLVEANIGNVYNTSDSGTTTQYFMQGAGVTINQGDSVSIIKAGQSVILFNLMGDTLDLTDYQKKDLTNSMTIGGTPAATVERALDTINNMLPSDLSSSNKCASMANAFYQTTNISAVNIEDILATIEASHKNFIALFTNNGTTGDLVTYSGQHLFNIVQFNALTEGGNHATQIAFAMATNTIYTRTKHWWSPEGWTDWVAYSKYQPDKIIDLSPYLINNFAVQEYFNYYYVNEHTIVINVGGLHSNTAYTGGGIIFAENLPFKVTSQRPLATLGSVTMDSTNANITAMMWIPQGNIAAKFHVGYGNWNTPLYGQIVVSIV